MRVLILLLLAWRLAAVEADLPPTLDAARARLLASLQLIAAGQEDEGLGQLIDSPWYVSTNPANELAMMRRYLGEGGDIRKGYGAPTGVHFIGTSYLTDLDATVAYGVVYENGLLPFAFGLFKTPQGYKLNLIKFGQTAAMEMLPFQRVEGR